MLVRMAIGENTIAFSLTLLRDLLSFENWRGEAKGIRGRGIGPPPSGYGPGGPGGGGTATGDQLNALTLKVYFTYINTSIKANFS